MYFRQENTSWIFLVGVSLALLLIGKSNTMCDVEEVELEPGETIEERIASCMAVLKRPKLTETDRKTVEKMLDAAQSQKKRDQGRSMSSLLKKYGVPPASSDVIRVDESPPKVEKKTTMRKSKATETPKSTPKQKKPRTDTPAKVTAKATTSAARKVKGPPTKRKVEEIQEPLADDSDVDVVAGSDYEPSSGESDHETDELITPSKKKKTRAGSAKKATGKRGPPWCSSDSDGESRGRSGITYTEDELGAMYHTALEDPDIIPGKIVRGVTAAEKNARRKALFKKIQRNVNAVGGNNRMKKALYKKFTDHKNRTKDKHRLLLQKYGQSGAGKVPDSEALTEGELLCLNFWGIEATGFIAGARSTLMDSDGEGDYETEDEAREMRKSELEEQRLVTEYKEEVKVKAERAQKEKEKAATSSKGKGVKRETYSELAARMGWPTARSTKAKEPDEEETERAASRKPARKVRTRRSPRSDAAQGDEGETTEGEESEEDPREHIPYTPASSSGKSKASPLPARVTRSSGKKAETKSAAAKKASKSKKTLTKVYAHEEVDSDVDDMDDAQPQGMPDLSDTPLDPVDEDGQMDYTMSSVRRQTAKASKTTSTPIEQVDLTSSPLNPAPGGPRGLSPAPSSDRTLPTPIKTNPADQGQKSLPKVPGPSGANRSTSSKNKSELSGDQEGLEVAFMHSELTCIREHIEKLASVPHDLTLLRNSVQSAQGDVGVIGTHSVAIKSDLSSVVTDVINTATDVSSMKTHVIGLRSDTMALKGDLHGLAKNVVEGKLVSKGTKEEVASARVDLVRVGEEVNLMKNDVLSVDTKASILVSDVSSLKHDVSLLKADIASIKRDVSAVKGDISNIAAGVQAIQYSLAINNGSAEFRDIGICTEIEQLDVKSEAASSEPIVVEEHVSDEVQQGEPTQVQEEGGEASLNTSEVSFRPHPNEVTYDKLRHVGKPMELDSEIDAIPDTQENVVEHSKVLLEGDILLSLPVRPTQEIPLQLTEHSNPPDTQEESQSLLQPANPPVSVTSETAETAIGQISEKDLIEAGPSIDERPYTIVSEARVEKDGKTFFVLETQLQETQEADNMFQIMNSTQNLPPPPPTPKKVKKGRRKEKR